MLEGPFIPVGRIKKPVDREGALRFSVYDEYRTILKGLKFIFIDHDGIFVPYAIVEFNTSLSKPKLKLKEISSSTMAERLKGKFIYLPEMDLPKEMPELSPLKYSGLEGFEVQHENQKIGIIVEVKEYPQQEIAHVRVRDKTHLIPLNSEFLIEINRQKKIVKMNLPEGLLML